MKTWQDLVSKQVLHCPACGGYGVRIEFRPDHTAIKCGCGYSKTEPCGTADPRDIPIPAEIRRRGDSE